MARPRKGKKPTVNFKGVEGKVLIPAGDYAAKVVEVSQEKGQEYDYLKWTFEITDGKFKGKKLFTNTSFNPASLWNLANLLTALGVEVPDGELEMELSEYVDLELNLVVDEDEYNGKPQSRVVDYYPADGESKDSDDEEDEDEDEKPAKGKKAAKGKGKSKDDDEDEDDEEEEEKPARGRKSKSKAKPKDEDEDEDEEEDEKPKRGAKGKKKPADEDEDEDEDDEPEEKVKTKGKAKGKKKGPEPVDADTLAEMDEDELGEVIETYELDVDLDDYKTMKKKIAAVRDALEEIEMLTE